MSAILPNNPRSLRLGRTVNRNASGPFDAASAVLSAKPREAIAAP